MPKPYAELDEGPRDAREAFQGRAGRRVHHPGRQAVHAPDPQRQAHRRRRAEVLHRHGEGKAHRLGRPPSCATRPTSSTSSSPRSSTSPRSRRPRPSPPASPPAPAPPPARSTSTPTAPPPPPRRARRSCSSATKPRPEDLRGMIAAEGILTAKGGVSSHAALVARQMGKVCICGACRAADRLRQEDRHRRRPDLQGRRLPLDRRHHRHRLRRPAQDRSVRNHHRASSSGDKAAQKTEKFKNFAQLMKWCAQGHHASHVRTNADTPEQTRNAIAFGATGIGLTRTEHMFFEGDRIDADARDDPRRQRSTTARSRAREAPALPARGLHRHLQGAQGLPGDHPPPRSAAPRVPAARRTTSQTDLAEEARRHRRRRSPQRVERTARVQPDARPPRLPPRHRLSRRSPRCRPAPSSKPPPTSQKKGIKVKPEIMIPLVGFKKELDLQVEIVHRVADRSA